MTDGGPFLGGFRQAIEKAPHRCSPSHKGWRSSSNVESSSETIGDRCERRDLFAHKLQLVLSTKFRNPVHPELHAVLLREFGDLVDIAARP